MDGSFFAFAVLGLLGYIVGDIQREFRYRREARANLAVAVDRLGLDESDTDRHGNGNGNGQPVAYRNGNSDSDFNRSPGGARREARRLAVRGDNYGLSLGPAPAGRNFRSSNAASVGKRRAEIDCY